MFLALSLPCPFPSPHLGLGFILLLLESLAVPQSHFLALHILYKNPRHPLLLLLSPTNMETQEVDGVTRGHTARDCGPRELLAAWCGCVVSGVRLTLWPWISKVPCCRNSYGFAHGIRVCAQHFLGQLEKNPRGLTFRPLCVNNYMQGHVQWQPPPRCSQTPWNCLTAMNVHPFPRASTQKCNHFFCTFFCRVLTCKCFLNLWHQLQLGAAGI